MSICPKIYYEMWLQGKTAREIKAVIRSLNNDIVALKKVIENTDYPYEIRIEADDQLQYTHIYLEEAKKALAESGVESKPSQSEIKALMFDENIHFVKTIEFCIGKYITDFLHCTIDLTGKYIKVSCTPGSQDIVDIPEGTYTTEDFRNKLRELHIGEWNKFYFDDRECIATEWYVIFYYSNAKKTLRIYGRDSYPYNFSDFCKIIGFNREQFCTKEQLWNKKFHCDD